MDEVIYERKVRRRACLLEFVQIILLFILGTAENKYFDIYEFLELNEFVIKFTVVFVVILLFEWFFRGIFKAYGTLKAAVIVSLSIDILIQAITNDKVDSDININIATLAAAIVIIAIIQFFYYNIAMIKYNKSNPELKEKNEYKLRLSRKLSNLLALRQILCITLILLPTSQTIQEFHFHIMSCYYDVVLIASVILASMAAVILEWKYNEFYEFIETGSFVLFVISTPFMFVLFGAWLHEPEKKSLAAAGIAWIICMIMFVLYRKGLKAYDIMLFNRWHEEKSPEEPEQEIAAE